MSDMPFIIVRVMYRLILVRLGRRWSSRGSIGSVIGVTGWRTTVIGWPVAGLITVAIGPAALVTASTLCTGAMGMRPGWLGESMPMGSSLSRRGRM